MEAWALLQSSWRSCDQGLGLIFKIQYSRFKIQDSRFKIRLRPRARPLPSHVLHEEHIEPSQKHLAPDRGVGVRVRVRVAVRVSVRVRVADEVRVRRWVHVEASLRLRGRRGGRVLLNHRQRQLANRATVL